MLSNRDWKRGGSLMLLALICVAGTGIGLWKELTKKQDGEDVCAPCFGQNGRECLPDAAPVCAAVCASRPGYVYPCGGGSVLTGAIMLGLIVIALASCCCLYGARAFRRETAQIALLEWAPLPVEVNEMEP